MVDFLIYLNNGISFYSDIQYFIILIYFLYFSIAGVYMYANKWDSSFIEPKYDQIISNDQKFNNLTITFSFLFFISLDFKTLLILFSPKAVTTWIDSKRMNSGLLKNPDIYFDQVKYFISRCSMVDENRVIIEGSVNNDVLLVTFPRHWQNSGI
jgi:hypothetical protein